MRGEQAKIAVQLRRNAGSVGIGQRQPLRREALIVERPGMVPASRREIARQRTSGDLQIVIPSHLADHPWRVVDAERGAVAVEKLRVAQPGHRCVAVEHRAECRDPVRQSGLDANAERCDRRRRSAGRQIDAIDRRPAEGAVDEEIVGFAVEELDVGGLLADPDVEFVVVKTLLEIGVVEPRIRQRFAFADGREVVHIGVRQPAAIDLIGVGEKPPAGPADQLFEIGIDGDIEPAEMRDALSGAA